MGKKEKKKQQNRPTMHRVKSPSKDGGISDEVVYVNFCTLFFGANTFLLYKLYAGWQIPVV